MQKRLQAIFPAVFMIFFMVLITLFSCKKNSDQTENAAAVAKIDDRKFIALVHSLDTMQLAEKKAFVKQQLRNPANLEGGESSPYFRYFSGMQDYYDDENESALEHFNKMEPDAQSDVRFLKNYSLISTSFDFTGTIPTEVMEEWIGQMADAEENKSAFTYQFYDLLARAYYQNRMPDKAELYTEKHFAASPFPKHPKIRQRHFDISFLLAAGKGDFEKMTAANNGARKLALQINDTVAYERTYDNETKIYARIGDMDNALKSAKNFVRSNERRNRKSAVPYNNLGLTYKLAGNADSALYYFKKANQIMNEGPVETQVPDYYYGLRDAYEAKGDYRLALIAADSARDIERRVRKTADAKQIEEIHEKYQSEKKDADIQALQNANLKKEKTINQQKWIFFTLFIAALGAFGLFYARYRNNLLKDKNALLNEENKRLSTERKMLQVQLNPHFVFNAIANLQGLISSGERSLATKYLNGFSKILRDTLDQSRKDFISLAEETESLTNYLKLQQMRFPDVFDFEITSEDDVDRESVQIPPMLIQPFVENSIEHGFRNIDYKGLIKVNFETDENRLKISIEDNGKGIVEKTGLESSKKSLSRVILKERLEALFGKYDVPGNFVVVNKTSDGNKGVNVKIELPKILD